MNAERFASRKWILALLVLLGGTALSLAGKLDPLLVELAKWIVGLYFAANVGQKSLAKPDAS